MEQLFQLNIQTPTKVITMQTTNPDDVIKMMQLSGQPVVSHEIVAIDSASEVCPDCGMEPCECEGCGTCGMEQCECDQHIGEEYENTPDATREREPRVHGDITDFGAPGQGKSKHGYRGTAASGDNPLTFESLTQDYATFKKVSEGRMVKGPGGVPLDRQGNPISPKAPRVRPLTQRQQELMDMRTDNIDISDALEAIRNQGHDADHLVKGKRGYRTIDGVEVASLVATFLIRYSPEDDLGFDDERSDLATFTIIRSPKNPTKLEVQMGNSQPQESAEQGVAEGSGSSLDRILAAHPEAVENFKQGGDLDYDLESDLWDYYFNNGEIRNYNADASEFISQRLADELGLSEGRLPQLPTRGADYSGYDTEHLKAMLKPGIMHRDELKFKTLIRRELKKREAQAQQGTSEQQ